MLSCRSTQVYSDMIHNVWSETGKLEVKVLVNYVNIYLLVNKKSSLYTWDKYYQWRIQDFPEVGAPTLGGGAPTYVFAKFFQKLLEILNLKEFGPPGGVSKLLLCRSATESTIKYHGLDELMQKVTLRRNRMGWTVQLNELDRLKNREKQWIMSWNMQAKSTV